MSIQFMCIWISFDDEQTHQIKTVKQPAIKLGDRHTARENAMDRKECANVKKTPIFFVDEKIMPDEKLTLYFLCC